MNRTWKLETIERAGSPSISVPNPEQYTLRMEDGGRLLIRADCNSCSGTYAMDGSALTISNLACTTAFCTLSSLDGNYAAALQSVRSVQVSGSLMTITGTGFTLRFRA
jgi:heat shock protein HslJ